MSDEPDSNWKRPGRYSPRNSGENNRPKREEKPDDSGKYPPLFSPEWHQQREAVMRDIAYAQRRNGVEWTDRNRQTSKLALDLAVLERGMIGYPEARTAYQHDAAEHMTDATHGNRIESTATELVETWKTTLPKAKRPTEMTEDEYPF